MKKRILFLVAFMFIGSFGFSQSSMQSSTNNATVMIPSVYDYTYKIKDIAGNDFNINSLAGKKVMIVNTASECGFTPQFAELQKLYEKHSKNLVIIGFPSNDFGEQEPGSNSDIATFCQKNYGVTFPMMSKIKVTGNDKHPLYDFLNSKAKNGYSDSKVEWNFQKYLIDESGKLVKVLPSKVSPLDESVIYWIENGKI